MHRLRSASAATVHSTLPAIVESRDGCPSDSISADLLLWLRSLRLSSVGKRVAKSAAAWRRAFASGYIFAELIDVTTARAKGSIQVEMHSFQPSVSSEDKKLDNWRLLLPLLQKKCGISLKIDAMEVLRIIRSRPGAALWLLEKMYRSWIEKGLVPETRHLRRGGSMPPAPTPPGGSIVNQDHQIRMNPLTKRRISARVAAARQGPAVDISVGTQGIAFNQNGKVTASDSTKLFPEPESTAITVGKIPL